MLNKKLVDLNPRWLGHGGDGIRDRDGNPVPHRGCIGLSFNCPCEGGERIAIYFENPVDGGPAIGEPTWRRVGEDFACMTLSPSLQRDDPGGCRWHGHLVNGEFVPC